MIFTRIVPVPLTEGQKIDAVKDKLIKIFKIDESKVEDFFSGKPQVLRKNSDLESCKKIIKSFKTIGAICVIEPEDEQSDISGIENEYPNKNIQSENNKAKVLNSAKEKLKNITSGAKEKYSVIKDEAKEKYTEISDEAKEKLKDIDTSELKDKSLKFFTTKIGIITGAIILIIVVWSLMPTTKTVSVTDTKDATSILKSEEEIKSEQLSALPEITDDVEFIKKNLKRIFSDKGFEITCFRLTDIFTYYITPAQEANGLEDVKRYAVRFAIKNKQMDKWIDIDEMKYKNENEFVGTLLWNDGNIQKDFLIDLQRWNGETQFSFTKEEFAENLNKSLDYINSPKKEEKEK
jgi:hypothetical protein